MHRFERLVAEKRAEMGLTGFPGMEGTRRLIDHIRAEVAFYHDADPAAAECLHWPDGTAAIWAPDDRPEICSHEVAHALIHAGLATWLEITGGVTAKSVRGREEREAERFARCWLLPVDVFAYFDEDEAMALSGCDRETVRKRREELEPAFAG